MKSSSGKHYIGLDHVRALAAFMVFHWHFTHAAGGLGHPVPFEFLPAIIPLAIFDEGHTGVALFMTLSGYLFAKLLEGKEVRFGAFLRNRFWRLFPLLLFVFFIVGALKVRTEAGLLEYVGRLASGFVWPKWPNGGWSVAVELQFYILLPFLMRLASGGATRLLLILPVSMLLRAVIYCWLGEVQTAAYWTIIGRIDQFVLGMFWFQARGHMAGKHVRALLAAAAFFLFFWWFDWVGGYYQMSGYPSASPLWIVFPTIEGLGYAALIAWYDNSFQHSTGWLSRALAYYGTVSFSIYLLHFFFIGYAVHFVEHFIMDLSNYYAAFAWSVVFFALMVVPATLTFRLIEMPCLKLRRNYLRPPSGA
jgi:peptidoglycan/LPS O-acetylase OafA/YrhL